MEEHALREPIEKLGLLYKLKKNDYVKVGVDAYTPILTTNTTQPVGFTVFKNGGDIRDVISVGKLTRKGDCPQEVEQMMNTMIKYGAKSEA